MSHKVKVIRTSYTTPDVKCFRLEKPEHFSFKPGQAAEISIDREGWEEEGRPFTFTSLPEEDELELTIKLYTDHAGVTNELHQVGIHDRLIIHEVFGTILYKGPGVFIAGGAGVTPFISILRSLDKKGELKGNRLIFGNKTSSDIILKDEFDQMLGPDFINILSEERTDEYAFGMMDTGYLQEQIKDTDQNFYVCGPPPMMDLVLKSLDEMGVKETSIVKEEF